MKRALVGAAAALALAAPASGATYPGFKPKPLFATPGSGAYCYVDAAGFEDDGAKLFCWRPRDGLWASIRWNGRRAAAGHRRSFPQLVHGMTRLVGYAPRARVLRYGRRWRYRCADPRGLETCGGAGARIAFTCVSARSGLTCRNERGHGFRIGRERGFARL